MVGFLDISVRKSGEAGRARVKEVRSAVQIFTGRIHSIISTTRSEYLMSLVFPGAFQFIKKILRESSYLEQGGCQIVRCQRRHPEYLQGLDSAPAAACCTLDPPTSHSAHLFTYL